MQWNELSWETQMKVLDKIEEILLKETDVPMQDAIVAAISELEVWSNSPCKISEDFEGFAFDPLFELDPFKESK